MTTAGRGPTAPSVMLVGPGPGTRGGIAQFNAHLAAALHETGVGVLILAFRKVYPSWTRPGRQGHDPSVEHLATGEVIRALVPWSPLSWIASARALHRRRPSAVVFQWWHPMLAFCYLALIAAARLSGARVAFVCHNVQPHESFPFAGVLTRLTLGRAARAYTLSFSVERQLRELVPQVPVTTLGHPPYTKLTDHPRGTRAPWMDALDRRGRKVVLFFGNVRPYKGLMDLLDAFPLVLAETPALLVVAGTFFESVERYRRRIAALNLVDDVFLLPEYIPDEHVGALLEVADVIVLPYRSGTQTGIAPLAARLGKPVVATSVGGLVEQLGAGARIAPPAQPEALAAALLETLTSADRPTHPPEASWTRWASEVQRFAEGVDPDATGGISRRRSA